jgi:hypothetical protein
MLALSDRIGADQLAALLAAVRARCRYDRAGGRRRVRRGRGAAERRSVRAGQRLIEVTWLTIIDAGRQALAG